MLSGVGGHLGENRQHQCALPCLGDTWERTVSITLLCLVGEHLELTSQRDREKLSTDAQHSHRTENTKKLCLY